MVSVTVAALPTVSIAPTGLTMDVGQTQTFTATSSGGSGTIHYQWYVGAGTVGTDSSSYTYTASGTSASITCKVTDSASTPVTSPASNAVSVTVNSALSAPTASASKSTVDQGQTSSLTSSAVSSGTSPYTYQWLQKAPGAGSYSSISGATLSSYSFVTSGSTTTGSWSFELQVTDAASTVVTSNSAAVTVNSAPTVNVSPTSWTMDVGQSKTFSATPSGGSGSYTSYQWYVGGSAQSGKTAQTFNYSPASSGFYLITVTVTDSLGATSAQSSAVTVAVNVAGATYFRVSGFPSSATAGVAHTVTVTIINADGNVATNYAGTVAITSSDSKAVLPTNGGLMSGVGSFIVTLETAGSQSITATDTSDSSITGSQTGITVSAAGLDHFVFNTVGAQTAGSAFSITVTAKDAYGNTVTGYTGTPSLTYSAGAISPGAMNAFVSGVGSTSVTVTAAGSGVTITATDGSISGMSNSFTVNPTISASAGANGAISPSGSVSVNYGGSQSFTITANAGYYIVDVTVNGSSVGAVSSYTFTNQAAYTISATFAPTPTATPVPTAAPTPAPTPTPKPTAAPTPSPTPSPTPTPSATTVPATTASGATVDLAISGNITSSQISNSTIIPYQSTATTTVSLIITGKNGTVGFVNMTIPKTAIPYGTSPVVYIDGQQAPNQGYTQDANNFYVWYTTQFNTNLVNWGILGGLQVTIQFAVPPTPLPTSLGLVLAVVIAVAAIILITVIAINRLRRKPDNALLNSED
jgi:hypothetical protein